MKIQICFWLSILEASSKLKMLARRISTKFPKNVAKNSTRLYASGSRISPGLKLSASTIKRKNERSFYGEASGKTGGSKGSEVVPKKVTIRDIDAKYRSKTPIVMITAYDIVTSRFVAEIELSFIDMSNIRKIKKYCKHPKNSLTRANIQHFQKAG